MKIMLSSPMPGCGKDTVADYLVDKYNYTKVSFAGPIYSIAKNYFDMKNKDRVLLQSIGQGFRSINKKVWIEEMEKRVEDIKELVGTDRIVISDLRQEDEYIWGMENDFTPLRISTTFEQAVDRIEKRDGQCDVNRFEHESEKGVEDKEMTTIYNDSTKEELYRKIDNFLKKEGFL